MTLIKSIAIEKPCDQSWQQMTEVNNGRYCDHCCKTVVDFTRMTDNEIIHYLSRRNNIYSRFNTQQLNKLNQNLSYNKKSFLNWKGWGLAAMIFGFSQYVEANTRPAVKVEQFLYQNKYEPIVDSPMIVRGKVIAKSDGRPMPWSTIRIKGTNEVTSTNINGEFKIEVRSTSDTLVASRCGYNSEEIRVSQVIALNDSITLQSSIGYLTGKVGGLTVRRPFYARAWYKLKYAVCSIFR